MTRRDALVRVIDALHAEIDALKANDVAALERATREKLAGIDAVGAANDDQPELSPELKALAELSDPRVTIDTAGLSPEATELANRLAERVGTLSDAELERLLALLKQAR
mgnify:CR=1 FL=1